MEPLPFDKEYKFLAHAFLDLITLGPKEFTEEFRQFATIVSPSIDSFKQNPNCDCRNKIIAYVEEHRETCYRFLEDFFNNEKYKHYNAFKDTVAPSILESKYNFTEAPGKIYEINDTPEDFYNFKLKMDAERFSFRQSYIIKDGDKLKIYFL